MKLAVIGGGSLYTPELIRGWLAERAVLPIDEIALMDLPAQSARLAVVADFSRRLIAQSKASVRLSAGHDLDEAVRGAQVVVNQFRVGGLSGRHLDETIPLRHGVVGQETTGPGGFAMALRTIPVAVRVGERVRELSAPGAWLLNFTNPAGLITEAVRRAVPDLSVVGLCNIPLIIRQTVAAAFAAPLSETTLEAVGLNHLSLFRVTVSGRDVTPAVLAGSLVESEMVANLPQLDRTSEAMAATARWVERLGWIPNPYFRYYLLPGETRAEAEAAAERGANRARVVGELEGEIMAEYRRPGTAQMPAQLAKRGGALYSQAALELLAGLAGAACRTTVNTANQGAIPDLPPEAVVEMDVAVDSQGIHPLPHPPLPAAARGWIQAVKSYEQLTVEAALLGDRDLALAALLAHPLVHGVDQASSLLADLLTAHREFLPAFFPKAAP